jgi:transposase
MCQKWRMDAGSDELPDDVATLKAMVIAGREREARMQHLIDQLRRAQFGQRSEKLSPDQLALALDDLDVAGAELVALGEQLDDAAARMGQKRTRKAPDGERGSLPAHLPRIEIVIPPAETECPCCGGALHVIDEDRASRLDTIPVPYRVVVTVRPKMACRTCSDGVFQAPAAKHIVPGGLPTEDLIADVVVRKYADHTPFYRQAQALRRYGIEIDRGTMCNWAGRSAAQLRRISDRMKSDLLSGPKVFADETTAKVLAPGTGKTKQGYLWAIASDNRPHGGTDPPAVVYTYMPGRGKVWADKLLGGFHGIVQCDGYISYKHLEAPDRKGGPATLAFCWAHIRRAFFDEAKKGNAPIADEALLRIAKLYAIEARVRGSGPERRRAVRQAEAMPLIESMKAWLEAMQPRLPKGSGTREAIGYALNHWRGLIRFLDDGRIELDNNTVERAIRPITLQRKNALFAGHDLGAENWACFASLIETCKLNGINPQAYLADVLAIIVLRNDEDPIDDLLPYNWVDSRIAAADPEIAKAA